MLGWTRNRFKTPRSGSSALEITISSLHSVDLEIWRFCGFSQDSVQKIIKNPNPPPNQVAQIWVSVHNFDDFFRNEKIWHRTCIYFSVSLKASGHESRVLGESEKIIFFYPASKTSTNLCSWTHCKSGSGYTGRLGHAYARPSRTAETKCAFGATK